MLAAFRRHRFGSLKPEHLGYKDGRPWASGGVHAFVSFVGRASVADLLLTCTALTLAWFVSRSGAAAADAQASGGAALGRCHQGNGRAHPPYPHPYACPYSDYSSVMHEGPPHEVLGAGKAPPRNPAF